MTRLVSLSVGGSCVPWSGLGLSCVGSRCELAGVSLEFTDAPGGLVGWRLGLPTGARVAPDTTEIDGIPTGLAGVEANLPARSSAVATAIGAQQVLGVDHVVVNTDDASRTCGAIAHTLGLEVRRTRDAGNGVEQRFFKLDNAIIEVVSGPHVRTRGASLWGLVISVEDLFELAEELGPEVMSSPKRATQPGRFISTVRQSVGLGVPLAMMTPHISGMATR